MVHRLVQRQTKGLMLCRLDNRHDDNDQDDHNCSADDNAHLDEEDEEVLRNKGK